MRLDLARHLEANARKRLPVFARLSRGAAAALSQSALEPLAEAVQLGGATTDDLLFAASIHGISGLLSALGEADPRGLPAAYLAVLHEARSKARRRGERALVTEDVAPGGVGKAEMRGASWTARTAGAVVLARGYRCIVERVEGLTLWLRAE